MKSFFSKVLETTPILRTLREFVVFWLEILWTPGKQPRIIVWKGRRGKSYREFYPKKFYLRSAFVVSLSIYTFTLIGLTILGISRGLIPSMDFEKLHQHSVLTSLRLQEVEDSLNANAQHLANLQLLLSGDPDSILFQSPALQTDVISIPFLDANRPPPTPASILKMDDQTSAFPFGNNLTGDSNMEVLRTSSNNYLASLQLPVLPPVRGLVTHGFDAEDGHYAIDIATSEGTLVRCIGDGYIIFSDWTYEGGHTIAVQHADGYVSVYKHNQRLLKQTGDRVQVREGIAISGDSGEYSSGPHLHFELWNNGLAQNPANYLIGY